MESRSNGPRLPPPWITPAAGKTDREVQPVITVNRRRPPASSGGVIATGGTETVVNIGGINYRVHVFTSTGTFNVTAGGLVEYLIIAGGGSGGGGSNASGCGGGGGAERDSPAGGNGGSGIVIIKYKFQ